MLFMSSCPCFILSYTPLRAAVSEQVEKFGRRRDDGISPMISLQANGAMPNGATERAAEQSPCFVNVFRGMSISLMFGFHYREYGWYCLKSYIS
jgi:hypothetical protein